MRLVKFGKNVSIPLTSSIYEAHLKDLERWLSLEQNDFNIQYLKKRITKINKKWSRYLGAQNAAK